MRYGGLPSLQNNIIAIAFLSENEQKNPVEKIQILLGVSSRSTNWAVLSEANSKPILYKIILKL